MSLFVGVLSGLVTILMMHYLFLPYPANQTSVAEGDSVTISGIGDIEMSLYATDATEDTTLANGKYYHSTEPGVMPGYYELKTVIIPSRYQVTGASALLTLSGNGTVENPGVVQRQENITQVMTKMMFVVGFIIWFFTDSLVNRKPETEPEHRYAI
jgi:hypothetical protein